MTHIEIKEDGKAYVIEGMPEEPKIADFAQYEKPLAQLHLKEAEYQKALASARRILVQDQMDAAERLIKAGALVSMEVGKPLLNEGIYSLPDVEWEEGHQVVDPEYGKCLSLQEQKSDNELYALQDLIDDFMGRKHWRMNPSHEWRSYHNDWNMLMPVVEKIESLLHDGGYNYLVTIGLVSCTIEYPDGVYICKTWEKEGDTKITFTYKAVVEFIKWFNSQKS